MFEVSCGDLLGLESSIWKCFFNFLIISLGKEKVRVSRCFSSVAGCLEVGLAELSWAPPRLKEKAFPRAGGYYLHTPGGCGGMGASIAPATHTLIYDFFLPQEGYIFPLGH